MRVVNLPNEQIAKVYYNTSEASNRPSNVPIGSESLCVEGADLGTVGYFDGTTWNDISA